MLNTQTLKQVKALKQIDNPDVTVPFLRTTLEALRKETEGRSTLLGFIGSPFTLAAYSVEGKVLNPYNICHENFLVAKCVFLEQTKRSKPPGANTKFFVKPRTWCAMCQRREP